MRRFLLHAMMAASFLMFARAADETSAEELRVLLDQVIAGSLGPEATVRALDTLATAASARNVRPVSRPVAKRADPAIDPDSLAITQLLYRPDPKLQAAAARLAGAWKLATAGDRLAQL